MFRLFKNFGKKDFLFIALAVLFITGQVVLELKMPEYMSNITVLVQTEGSEMSEILRNGGLMLLCAFGSLVSTIIAGWFVANVGADFTYIVRKKIFDKVEELSIDDIRRFSTASLITRTTNDVTQVRMVITMGANMLIRAPLSATWAIIKISGKNWQWSTAAGVAVVHHGIKPAHLRLEASPGVGRGKGDERGVASGIGEVDQRGVEVVPLVVYTQVHVPVGNDGIFVGAGDVNLVLPEFVVNEHQRGVRVVVVHEVAGILGVDHHLEAVAQAFLPASLGKEVAVPLALRVHPHIVDDSSRDAALAIVVVELSVPLAVFNSSEYGAFGTECLHITVLAHGSGVPSNSAVAELLAVTKVILACSIGVFGTERHGEVSVEAMLPTQAGVSKTK